MYDEYENKKDQNFLTTVLVIILMFVLILFSIILTGCKTNRVDSGSYTSTVIEYQRRVESIKAENERLTRIIDSARDDVQRIITEGQERFDDIRRRSSEISDSIERIEYLIREYDSEVRTLLSENERLRELLDKRESDITKN